MLWILPLFLIIIGFLGLILNKKNLLLIFLSLEILLLGVNTNFLLLSLLNHNIIGQIISLLILTLAAAEASLGLALLLAYYRVRGSIAIASANILRI